MAISLLIYIITAYLILVLGVVLAATHRRINLFKTFLISLLLTPISGIIALCKVQKKVVVTYYNPLSRCADCPFADGPRADICESCEFIGKLENKLSVKKRYSI